MTHSQHKLHKDVMQEDEHFLSSSIWLQLGSFFT